MKREYLHKITEKEMSYTELITVDDWIAYVQDGMFIPYDGSGVWVKDGYRSDDDNVWSQPYDATHVAWYNK